MAFTCPDAGRDERPVPSRVLGIPSDHPRRTEPATPRTGRVSSFPRSAGLRTAPHVRVWGGVSGALPQAIRLWIPSPRPGTRCHLVPVHGLQGGLKQVGVVEERFERRVGGLAVAGGAGGE